MNLMLEISGDCRTVVDWVNGHAKLNTPVKTVAAAQNLMWKCGAEVSTFGDVPLIGLIGRYFFGKGKDPEVEKKWLVLRR